MDSICRSSIASVAPSSRHAADAADDVEDNTEDPDALLLLLPRSSLNATRPPPPLEPPPAVLLATVMVVELALAGDAALHGSTVYAVAVGASLVLLGLFRLDRRARNASLQVPTGEAWQYAEARVRGVCTACTRVRACDAHRSSPASLWDP